LKILFSIFTLLLISLFTTTAFADDYNFDVGEIQHGKDFEKQLLSKNLDGNQIFTVETTPAKLEDYPNHFVNFRYYDTDNLSFESANIATTFQKSTCTLKLFDKGFLNSTNAELINSISQTVKEALNGTDNWSLTSVNDAACQTSYVETASGLVVSQIKNNEWFGSGGRFETISVINYAGTLKQSFKYTNLDNSKTDHKYGFTQVLDGGFIVIVNNQTYNTATIQDTVTITKEELGNNVLEIKTNEGFSILFDTQNYEHHYLWVVKIAPNKITIDYTFAKGRLNVGDTLEIDPTFNYALGTNLLPERLSGSDGCTGTYQFHGSLYMILRVDTTDAINGCSGMVTQWDLSTIPDGATITNSSYKVTTLNSINTGAMTCVLNQVTHNINTANAETLYNDVMNTANGSSYVTGDTRCRSSSTTIDYDLGATADADIQAGLTNDRFAVGAKFTSMVVDGSTRYITLTTNPQLKVTYLLPPPNPPTITSCTGLPYGISCTWTPPNPASDITSYWFSTSLTNVTGSFTNTTSTGNVTSAIKSGLGINTLYFAMLNATNGANSTESNHYSVTTDAKPDAPTLSAQAISTTQINVTSVAGATNGGDIVKDFSLRCEHNYAGGWITEVSNSTLPTNRKYTIGGLSSGNVLICQWRDGNGVGFSDWSGNTTTSTYQTIAGTISFVTRIVGNVMDANATVSIINGTPAPNISLIKLFKDGVLVDSLATNQNITTGGSFTFPTLHNIWLAIQTNNFTMTATATNVMGTKILNSSSLIRTTAYMPGYTVIIPTVINTNYTDSRNPSYNTLHFVVLRDGTNWTLNCSYIIKQADTPIWINNTNRYYIDLFMTVNPAQNYYFKCYNPNTFVFQFTSYGNNNGTLAGVQALDDTLGSFFGLPMIFMFVLLFAGLFGGRNSGTGIVILLSLVALAGAIGLLVIDQGVWGICLIAGSVGLMAGKKLW
jgi:hypothetical protein